MKIALNMDELSGDDKKAAQAALERLIKRTKDGDFQARDALIQHYMPILSKLAKKRSSSSKEFNETIEAGKAGLCEAARKYKPSVGPDKFQVFALDFIEKAMDKGSSSGGFLARLLGR
jgi:DNA-directed RNA polymerase specialized sigma subunit